MNNKTLDAAISEAKRFIKAAEELKKCRSQTASPIYWCGNPKESGAVRRASMDLTRALAEMRKPG